ncbi:hypothetical protein ACPC36_07930 [Streptomyces pseudogriseolus]|uniref:hypothetical protein n=1 Tax=Streptomyces pseudogriseolus TaxID=36817 RepID=UPI003FA32584
MTSTTTYRVEFGPAWPVPPITVDFADRTAAARQVAEHAIPHLRPVLAEKGRPELADCFFQTDRALTGGQFMWLDLASERATRFCPARLTPIEPAEETHVVADDSDDPEHIDDCPGCPAL